MMTVKQTIRKHKRASLIGTAMLVAIAGLLVPAINAPSSNAAQHVPLTTQHTIIGNAHVAMAGPNTDLAIVLGHDFPHQTLLVTVVAGSKMRQAHVMPESDGRVSLVTYLPKGYTGAVRAIVQFGTQTTVIDKSPGIGENSGEVSGVAYSEFCSREKTLETNIAALGKSATPRTGQAGITYKNTMLAGLRNMAEVAPANARSEFQALIGPYSTLKTPPTAAEANKIVQLSQPVMGYVAQSCPDSDFPDL